MSGGHYNYAYHKIEDLADAIIHNHRGDPLHEAFVQHLRLVATAAKAIEWEDSDDGDPEVREKILKVLHPKDTTEAAVRVTGDALERLRRMLQEISDGK